MQVRAGGPSVRRLVAYALTDNNVLWASLSVPSRDDPVTSPV